MIGDQGYLSRVIATLKKNGLNLIARLHSNMNRKLKLTPEQKYYIRHRGFTETVFDILKHQLDIEHFRCRSAKKYSANIFGALTAYTFSDKKMSIPAYMQKFSRTEFDNASVKSV